MTSWTPTLADDVPRYRAIADALASDMASGRLTVGTKLPTHRDLAFRLGVTVGTVTRAYAEAERRGLVVGEVGRGTFVRAQTPDAPPSMQPHGDPFRAAVALEGPLDLSMNLPAPPCEPDAVPAALAEVCADPAARPLFGYTDALGLPEHRAAGAAWMARTGLQAEPERIVPTHGGQHAMFLACAALCGPGDPLLVEEATFYGIKSIARTLDLRLVGVPTDAEGLEPAALEAAIRSTGARALYTVPTFQNPTSSVMPEARRDEIAAICRRHGISVIEDDLYGFLLETPATPLSARIPELGYYLTALSKSVSPALRTGWLAAPPGAIERLAVAERATTIMPNPLMQEASRRLIASGAADRLAEGQRAEAIARQALARETLGPAVARARGSAAARARLTGHPNAFHLWLQLPAPWRTESFLEAARRRGVNVAAGEVFFVGRTLGQPAVRICLSSAPNRARLRHALEALAALLCEEPALETPLV